MRTLLLAGAAALFVLPAQAQNTRLDVKTLNFDMWCQETAKIDPDRCDKRTPEDEKAFEAYRAKIEKYEVPYLKNKEKQQMFDQNVLHNDPIDNPVDKSYSAQTQSTPSSTEPQP
ncbi:MAG TPA: hypothetical protein VMF58_05755 [Rhizomicrobium sp.]|nr:hypothetical protein [Rhizomicrobium sp.]